MVKRIADPDRGGGLPRGKDTIVLDEAEYLAREAERAGFRDLDAMVEGMSGLTQAQKDRERILPRATTAPLGDPRMRRTLPDAAQVRRPLSARQRNARSKTRHATEAALPHAQLAAQYQLVSVERRWSQVNDALSDNIGDVQALPESGQRQVRRIDRAIQAYERVNDRGHVLYTNVRLPPNINRSNLEGFLDNNFTVGRTVSFDRYTQASHQLHETVADVSEDPDQFVVFEMQTRRGAYLGRSDKLDDTAHLLPRGMRFSVVGMHHATFQRPDGSTGVRRVVQLRDITPADTHRGR